MKVLSIRLANLGRSVAYLACAEVSQNPSALNLITIVQRFGRTLGLDPKSSPSDTILLIDALDEASYDLSKQILAGSELFLNVVVSCRAAFQTELRGAFPQLTVSKFNETERNEFFKKWFSHRPERAERAAELMRQYPDLATHTCVPLIATVLVALLENGIEPKTRAEVYSMRLDLLLSKWDKSRGVRRLQIDIPEAKRRFLRRLAHKLHSSSGRRRLMGLEFLEAVYAESLGKWGYDRNFATILNDLVVGSGILIEERTGIFSFGHLTFQEYLSAEFLAFDAKIAEVAKHVGDDWWREPLNFYASIRGDITELLAFLMERGDMAGYEQRQEMIQYAPYTSVGAVDALS